MAPVPASPHATVDVPVARLGYGTGGAAAHRLLGNTLALQGRFTEAVEWWQRWLKIAAYEPRLAADVDPVQEAVQAAQTLDLLLRGPRG